MLLIYKLFFKISGFALLTATQTAGQLNGYSFILNKLKKKSRNLSPVYEGVKGVSGQNTAQLQC